MCLVLSTVLVFGMMFSVTYGMGTDIDPMQKVILEAIDLDDSARTDLVNVLKSANSSNYKDYVDEVSDILPLSDEDITAALKSFVNYSSTYKSSLLLIIENYELSAIDAEEYTLFGFQRIRKIINFEVTGDYYDDRGIELFVSIFDNLKTLTGKEAFYDDSKDVYKLDIKVETTTDLKSELNKLIGMIQSLKLRGITTFDGFVTYVEQEINAHYNMEIYNFKRFLVNQDLGYKGALKKPTIDEPTVSAIQKIYIELISLSKAERDIFANEILMAIKNGDMATAREKAQKIFGSMPSEDINAALAAIASYSDDKREYIKSALSLIPIDNEGYDTSGFSDIHERINFAFTGNYDDEKGFLFFAKILGTIKGMSGDDYFIFDDSSNKYKINVDLSKNAVYTLFKSKLDIVVRSMDTLTKRGIYSFDDYIAEFEAIVNAHSNEQIYNFKKLLGDKNLGYGGNLPDPNEITQTFTPTVTPTSTTTAKVTPTQTSKPTSTGTSISTPTPTPAGTSASNQTYKPAVTPVVTEPKVTDGPAANPFTDLTDTHWAKVSILELAAKKIITGYTDGTVKPDRQITRAEMAVVIAKAIGLEPAATPGLKFKDNKDIPSWAAGYIQAAVEKNIIVGYEDNTFRPSNKLTREEMVVMVLKAYLYQAVESPVLNFTDKKDIGSWSAGYIAKSVELGYVVGYPDNSFKPKKDVTRAEAANVISQCIKGLEKSGEKKAGE